LDDWNPVAMDHVMAQADHAVVADNRADAAG